MTEDSDNREDTVNPGDDQTADEGPGCMPAVIAAMALLGILGFIACGFSTWVLFQKRTELAIRTIRDAYLPELQQSLLEPATKTAVVGEVQKLASDLERGKYEDWQSAGILQRLQRLPVLQWGDLQAIEAFLVKTAPPEQSAEGLRQLSRLKRAVEVGKMTSFDFEEVLKPVYQDDPTSPNGHRLIQPLQLDAVSEVIEQARLTGDRFEIPDEDFSDIKIEAIVRQQIQAGASEGTF